MFILTTYNIFNFIALDKQLKYKDVSDEQWFKQWNQKDSFEVANLSIAIWEMVKDGGARHAAIHGATSIGHNLATEQQQFIILDFD